LHLALKTSINKGGSLPVLKVCSWFALAVCVVLACRIALLSFSSHMLRWGLSILSHWNINKEWATCLVTMTFTTHSFAKELASQPSLQETTCLRRLTCVCVWDQKSTQTKHW